MKSIPFIFLFLFFAISLCIETSAQTPDKTIQAREQLWLGYFNRCGMGYQFTSHRNAQLGYMNVYQQEASGSNYYSTHAIRLFIFHTLDLRKENSK